MNEKTINLFNHDGVITGQLECFIKDPEFKTAIINLLQAVFDAPELQKLDNLNCISIGYETPLFILNANSTQEIKVLTHILKTAVMSEDFRTVRKLLDECERVIMESVTLQRNTSSIH